MFTHTRMGYDLMIESLSIERNAKKCLTLSKALTPVELARPVAPAQFPLWIWWISMGFWGFPKPGIPNSWMVYIDE